MSRADLPEVTDTAAMSTSALPELPDTADEDRESEARGNLLIQFSANTKSVPRSQNLNRDTLVSKETCNFWSRYPVPLAPTNSVLQAY